MILLFSDRRCIFRLINAAVSSNRNYSKLSFRFTYLTLLLLPPLPLLLLLLSSANMDEEKRKARKELYYTRPAALNTATNVGIGGGQAIPGGISIMSPGGKRRRRTRKRSKQESIQKREDEKHGTVKHFEDRSESFLHFALYSFSTFSVSLVASLGAGISPAGNPSVLDPQPVVEAQPPRKYSVLTMTSG